MRMLELQGFHMAQPSLFMNDIQREEDNVHGRMNHFWKLKLPCKEGNSLYNLENKEDRDFIIGQLYGNRKQDCISRLKALFGKIVSFGLDNLHNYTKTILKHS